jgi:hypothetical protein
MKNKFTKKQRFIISLIILIILLICTRTKPADADTSNQVPASVMETGSDDTE